MKILLVEDDVWLAEMYAEVLEVAGFDVSVAVDAANALDICDTKKFDLLIVDIYLPDFNGFALLHELRSHSDTKHLPAVVLSSVEERTLAMSKSRWEEYGVVSYLYKPSTRPLDLVISVRRELSSLVESAD